jgi:hypothetical protein
MLWEEVDDGRRGMLWEEVDDGRRGMLWEEVDDGRRGMFLTRLPTTSFRGRRAVLLWSLLSLAFCSFE